MHRLIGSIFIGLMLVVSGCSPTEADIAEDYREVQSLIDKYREDFAPLNAAAELLDAMESRFPNSKYTHVGLGRLSYKLGHRVNYEYSEESLDIAKEYFKQAIAIDPDFFDAYYYGSYAYLVSGDLDTALEMAEDAKRLEPESFYLDLLLAQIARTVEKPLEVIEHSLAALGRAEVDEKGVDEAQGLLSDAYTAAGDYVVAEQYYNKVINTNPVSAFARSNYSRFLSNHSKDYDKAIQQATVSLSLKDYGVAHKTLAYAYYKKAVQLMWTDQKHDEALVNFSHASHHNRSSSNIYYGLGSAYFVTGFRDRDVKQIKLGEIHLQRAVELSPNNEPALEQLAEVKKVLEKYGK
jgi:tetratricopeptide (TPR) repeat protein